MKLKHHVLVALILVIPNVRLALSQTTSTSTPYQNERVIKDLTITQHRGIYAFELFRQTCLADFVGERSLKKTVSENNIKTLPIKVVQKLIGTTSDANVYDFSNKIGNFAVAYSEVYKGMPVCTMYVKDVDTNSFIGAFQKDLPKKGPGIWVSDAKISKHESTEIKEYDLNFSASDKALPSSIGSMALVISNVTKAETDILSLTIAFGRALSESIEIKGSDSFDSKSLNKKKKLKGTSKNPLKRPQLTKQP